MQVNLFELRLKFYECRIQFQIILPYFERITHFPYSCIIFTIVLRESQIYIVVASIVKCLAQARQPLLSQTMRTISLQGHPSLIYAV